MNTFGSGLDVTLVRPEVVLIEEPIFVTGNILPHKTTNLTPAVSGLIEEVHVGVGDRVNKGDALLTIRQSDIKLQVESSLPSCPPSTSSSTTPRGAVAVTVAVANPLRHTGSQGTCALLGRCHGRGRCCAAS